MEGWLAFSQQFLSPLSQYRSSMMGNVYAFYSENFGDILDPTPLYVIDPDCYLDLGPNLWQLCGSHFRATCSTMLIHCSLLYCGGGTWIVCKCDIWTSLSKMLIYFWDHKNSLYLMTIHCYLFASWLLINTASPQYFSSTWSLWFWRIWIAGCQQSKILSWQLDCQHSTAFCSW